MLTGKISNSQREKAIDLLLSGCSYQQVASRAGIGKSTVSGIVKDLQKQLRKNDIQEIIGIAKLLRKKNLNFDDAYSGSRIHGIVQKMNFDDDSLFDFLSQVYSECQKNNLDAKNLCKYSEMLFRLQKSSEMPLEDTPSHVDAMLTKRRTRKRKSHS